MGPPLQRQETAIKSQWALRRVLEHAAEDVDPNLPTPKSPDIILAASFEGGICLREDKTSTPEP